MRGSPGVCDRPDAEVVDPDLAIDVIHIVVVQDILELDQTPRHDPPPPGQQRGDVAPTAFCERKGAVEREGERAPVGSSEGRG